MFTSAVCSHPQAPQREDEEWYWGCPQPPISLHTPEERAIIGHSALPGGHGTRLGLGRGLETHPLPHWNSAAPSYHSTATNSIHVAHHTAPGETVHLHSLSTSALKKLLVTCYHLSKSSAGPYSTKYPSREGNEKVSGEFLAPAAHPTAGQQTRFGPCCFSNVTWHLHAHVGGDTTMPNACLAEKP